MATVTKGKTFTSGETVTPAKLNDVVELATVTEIVNADIKSDAAIAGTKIAPDFGSQNVVTSGTATSSKFIPTGTSATGNGMYLPAANEIGFSTNGAERARITSGGAVCIGTTDNIDAFAGSDTGISMAGGAMVISRSANTALRIRRVSNNGAVVGFNRDGVATSVGLISVTTTATTYSTSSDYRLKQNVEPMVGGLAKLAALAPKTFEFVNEPNVKVDGFIAHEVQAVVPQAVTGEKDGEEMQGLDHGKLVPVLVAAVQELSARVAALEAAQNK
jgi:hypothetical protein